MKVKYKKLIDNLKSFRQSLQPALKDIAAQNIDDKREDFIDKIIDGKTGFSLTPISKDIKSQMGIAPPRPFLQTGHYIRAIRIKIINETEAAMFIKETPAFGLVDVSGNKTIYQVCKYRDVTMIDVAKALEKGEKPVTKETVVYASYLNVYLKVKLYAPKSPWDWWKTFFDDWRQSAKIIRIDKTLYKKIIDLFNEGKVVKIEKSKVLRISENKHAKAIQRYPRLPEGVTVKRRK